MPSPYIKPSQGHPERSEKYSQSPMKNRCGTQISWPESLCTKEGARHGQHAKFLHDSPPLTNIWKWGAFALQTTVSMGRGNYCAHQLAALVWKFLDNHTFLPVNPYGDWNHSMPY